MDKAKPLAGTFAFIILSSFSHYAFGGDGTNFAFRNSTSEEYEIHYLGDVWFNPDFKNRDIPIPAGKTQTLYLEGNCAITDNSAAINWEVRNKNDQTKKEGFRLVVSNHLRQRCAKRYFMVGPENKRQYRKIELAPISAFFPSNTTATPYFRFTIRDRGNSVIFEQEGPQGGPFN